MPATAALHQQRRTGTFLPANATLTNGEPGPLLGDTEDPLAIQTITGPPTPSNIQFNGHIGTIEAGQKGHASTTALASSQKPEQFRPIVISRRRVTGGGAPTRHRALKDGVQRTSEPATLNGKRQPHWTTASDLGSAPTPTAVVVCTAADNTQSREAHPQRSEP